MSDKVHVRFANKADYLSLPRIEKSAAKAFLTIGMDEIADMEPLSVSFYNELEQQKPFFIFVAENENLDLLGFCLVIFIDEQPHIKELSVSAEHTGKGIGTLLIQNVVKESKNRDYQAITLTTFTEVPFNAPFYQKLGFAMFTPEHDWPELHSTLQDEKAGVLKNYKRTAMIKNI